MLLLAMGALPGLAACGQKGPLVLPASPPAAAGAAVPAASAPGAVPATGTGAPR